MFKFLRIACALIAAALAAVCVLVGVFTESLWAAIGVAAGAALFFALCLLFKYLQEEQEEKAAKAQQAQNGAGATAQSDEQTAVQQTQNAEGATQNGAGAAAAEAQPHEQDTAQGAPQNDQNKDGQND